MDQSLYDGDGFIVFVVKMNRYGNPEKHSYILGIYENVSSAHYAGTIEEYWRGGKYRKEINHYHGPDEVDKQKEKWYLENVVGKENDH